jgi:hypothetical protein
MSRYPFVVTLAVALAAAGCGGSREEAKKEEAANAMADTKKAAEDVANSAGEMAKGLGALAESYKNMAEDANMKPVDPVSFRDLQTVFGDLSGWEKGKPTGERMTSPVPFSQSTVTYTMGDARINAKIVDSGFNQLLMAPYMMFLTAGYEKETDSGYEKSVKVGSYPGWEKWDSNGKDGELHLIVNKRFLVEFEGNGLESTKPLYDLAQSADLAKLAAMK